MSEKCSYCGEEGHSIQQCPKWKSMSSNASNACSLLMQRAKKHLEDMRKEVDRAKERLRALDETLSRIGVTNPEEIKKRRAVTLESHRQNMIIFSWCLREDTDIAEALKCSNAPEIVRMHDIEGVIVNTDFERWIGTVLRGS